MLFKQTRFFALKNTLQSSASDFAEKLQPFIFNACTPNMASSMGWVPPIDDDLEPLARGINQCIMFCLQVEEKILPASVVNQTLKEKIKLIETQEGRKIRQKEKFNLKDEIIFTLLPRAFSKLTRIHAYIDTRNNWLMINSLNASKVDLFIAMLNKACGDLVEELDVIKLPPLLSHWLKNKSYPAQFSIEKTCVLQDPQQQNRTIRCSQQDLFAGGIQSLLKDGCEVMQVGLCWQDKITFILNEDFTLRSIKLIDEDTTLADNLETQLQKFNSDFMVMSELFAALLKDLCEFFVRNASKDSAYSLGAVA